MNDLSVIDRPLTKADENNFYGSTVRPWEMNEAQHHAERNYDDSDVCEDAAEHADEICAALANGDEAEAGHILAMARQATINRRAERSLGIRRSITKLQNTLRRAA